MALITLKMGTLCAPFNSRFYISNTVQHHDNPPVHFAELYTQLKYIFAWQISGVGLTGARF